MTCSISAVSMTCRIIKSNNQSITSLHDLQVDLSINRKTCLKDVQWHHVPFRAVHTKDHYHVWELGLHHSGHIVGAHSNSSMVLPVVGLVLAEILLIREEPQHVGLLWVLQLVEELGGVKQLSVLVAWVRSWPVYIL